MTSSVISQKCLQPGYRTGPWALLEKLTGFPEPKPQQKMRGFSLRLGDGSSWWIAGSPQASFVVETLGKIMQLPEGGSGDDHLMFFYEKHADQEKIQFPLKSQEWIYLYPRHFQIFFHRRWHHILCEYGAEEGICGTYALMSCAVHAIHWASIFRGGLPFHATLLEHQGQGVVLAAPAGTGKSTCGRRVVPPWKARSDDGTLVVLSPEGRYLAHPFPTWSEYLWEQSASTWNVEDAVPLAGIFFLQQAPEDECLPLVGAQAAAAATYSAEQVLFFQFLCEPDSLEPRELRQTVFANACEIVKRVPTFLLRVSLTGRFWEKIEAALGWR